MKRVLVIGVETIVGSNIALTLSKHHHVVGLSATNLTGIAGVEVRLGIPQSPEEIRRELALTSPELVVHCGPASQSIWSQRDANDLNFAGLKPAAFWARELAGTNSKLIVISSDSVFQGPWMFHEEECSGVCRSAAASAIREMEAGVLKECPSALILRTHAFGWSPLSSGGWLEKLLDEMADETALSIPAVNYATPIAAGRLAEMVIQAWERKLEGVYHIGGSERVNFRHFAHRLAQEFQLPRPKFGSGGDMPAPHTFGQGETSLNSHRFRRSVGAAVPMLSESLRHLREQTENGEKEQLQTEEALLTAHAA